MKILIINPNSNTSMTLSLENLLNPLSAPDTTYTFFTAPSGPISINNQEDCLASADVCLPALLPLLNDYDAFLVACYSAHPLVPALQAATPKPVTGILEASVGTALMLLQPGEAFGIVSTGNIWEELLANAVMGMLGGQSSRFAGVETTGLNAKELHDTPMEDLKSRMVGTTRRLLRRGNVGAVCLGCAAMVGFDIMVREAAIAEMGMEKGRRVKVIDGVAVASGVLRSLVVSQKQ